MEISRSKWDNFIKCPLCFYLLEKHQIKPPGTPGHPINSRVDSLLKEEFVTSGMIENDLFLAGY